MSQKTTGTRAWFNASFCFSFIFSTFLNFSLVQESFAQDIDGAMFWELQILAQTEPAKIDDFVETNANLISDNVVSCFRLMSATNEADAAMMIEGCRGNALCEQQMRNSAALGTLMADVLEGKTRFAESETGKRWIAYNQQVFKGPSQQYMQDAMQYMRPMFTSQPLPFPCQG